MLNARNRTENHGHRVGAILASGDFSVQDWAVRYAITCVGEVPLWFYLVAYALQTTYWLWRPVTTFRNSALIGLLVVANVC